MLKGNFGNALAALTTKSVDSMLVQPARYRNGNFFFGVNGADKAFVWGGLNSSLLAYRRCPVVASVIHRLAQCTVNGRTKVMDLKGKEATSKQADALRKLLARPNPMQTQKEFRAQGDVYKRIYGYKPVLVVKPVGFEDDYSAWQFWNLPPWMLRIQDKSELFFLQKDSAFASIWLSYLGNNVPLDPRKVFFIKENQISTGVYQATSTMENVSLFLPDSRLISVAENISTLIASLEGRGQLNQDRGPLWVLTNDSGDAGEGTFPIDPEERDRMQEDFRQYGIGRAQRRAIITDAKLKLQEVGFDVKQLQLLEGEVQDAKMICDALHYPPYLMGLVDSKFDNQAIAERTLYVNSVIPDAESEDEQWVALLGCDRFGLTIKTDYSHLAALQENITEQGRGRYYMNQALLIEWFQNGITWNRWRELLGEDTVDGMDKYYYELVAEGKVFGAIPNSPIMPPIDNAQTGNNGQTSNAAA